jgi:hypothetical protein
MSEIKRTPEMHAGQKLIIDTLQTAMDKQSIMEAKSELFDELVYTLKTIYGVVSQYDSGTSQLVKGIARDALTKAEQLGKTI